MPLADVLGAVQNKVPVATNIDNGEADDAQLPIPDGEEDSEEEPYDTKDLNFRPGKTISALGLEPREPGTRV